MYEKRLGNRAHSSRDLSRGKVPREARDEGRREKTSEERRSFKYSTRTAYGVFSRSLWRHRVVASDSKRLFRSRNSAFFSRKKAALFRESWIAIPTKLCSASSLFPREGKKESTREHPAGTLLGDLLGALSLSLSFAGPRKKKDGGAESI